MRYQSIHFLAAIASSCCLVTCYDFGSPSFGGNGTFPLLKSYQDDSVIANVRANINLTQFEMSGSTYLNEDGSLNKRSDDALEWLQIEHYDYSNVQLDVADSNRVKSVKRQDIHDCVTWVEGAGRCLRVTNEVGKGMWDLAFKIKQLATAKQCSEIHGQNGGFYYRYWAAGGDCGTTAEQKTIAGAISEAIDASEGEWFCNIFCLKMTHGGTWQGTLLIGPTESAMFANCGGKFKGCYDAGCSSLKGWYSCKS